MGEIMGSKIVALISCFLCAVPFFIISKYDKDSRTPVNFWSGDKTLKDKVKNVPEYNKAMAELYRRCAIAFLITGVSFLAAVPAGLILLAFDCTVGIYIVWRKYKKILNQYS